jgi:hypothetical protein
MVLNQTLISCGYLAMALFTTGATLAQQPTEISETEIDRDRLSYRCCDIRISALVDRPHHLRLR